VNMASFHLIFAALLPLAMSFQAQGFIISNSRNIHQKDVSALELSRNNENQTTARRNFLQSLVTASTSAAVALSIPSSSLAAVDVSQQVPVEMRTFVDPKGLFALTVPKRFFAIRRTNKGDLPDEKTGKGRRGSSIFTAGDLSKAEVIAVERFPTFALLEDEGILVEKGADLSTFPAIGDAAAIANLIVLRRDKDKPTQTRTNLLMDSVRLSEDGKTLYFSLSTAIDVQKPELLLEQEGVSELVRITQAKATLMSNDGQLLAVFASALQQDYIGADGVALKETVESFVATDQSK